MMKRISNYLNVSLFFGVLFSGMTIFAAPDGQKILDQMSAGYRGKAPCVLSFEIIQYYDRNQEDYQSSVGSFYIADTSKFRVDFIDQEIIYDGTWLWSFDKQSHQVIIEPLDPQSSLKFIFDMLFGNWENFKVVSLEAPRNSETISLGLKTRDNNEFFNAIFLKIGRETPRLHSATYLDFNNLKTVIEFSEPRQIKQTIASILFDTKRLEAKEVIDLRP